MKRISKDALECLYAGLAIGIGIIGFIIVALITNTIMPVWAEVSEFANFLMICGWAAVTVIYVTLYAFTATYIYPSVKKAVLGEEY